jgi:transposase-like protein
MIDIRRLRPIELCRLLNSTPLGQVITEQELRNHRVRTGTRLGSDRTLDLLGYIAWLVELRHAPKAGPKEKAGPPPHLAEAAAGAAAIVGTRLKKVTGHGQKTTSRQEAVIAALLTEPTYAKAAAKAGVSASTVYKWLRQPAFRQAYRRARQELIEHAIGRIQAATGQAVETLLHVATHARRDSDRVRASVALINHSLRGLEDGDLLHGRRRSKDVSPMSTEEVVGMLSARLRQIDKAELTAPDKSRLTAGLADALLRAIGVDVIGKRLESLHTVLAGRKEAEVKKSKVKKQ